jgi:hypothetical protein
LPLMSLYFSALRTTSTDRSAIWDGLYLNRLADLLWLFGREHE